MPGPFDWTEMRTKEQRAAYMREWTRRNKERLNSQRRGKPVSEEVKQYRSEWQKENRDKNNAARKRWLDKPGNREKDREQKRVAALVTYRENPIKRRLGAIKARAKKQGVKFNLTEDWFLAHFNICEVTGIELNLDSGSPWLAEVDRIIPGGDYTMDNCRLVCAIYNRSRMTYTDADVKRMATALIGR